jgi:hypothetical protein
MAGRRVSKGCFESGDELEGKWGRDCVFTIDGIRVGEPLPVT